MTPSLCADSSGEAGNPYKGYEAYGSNPRAAMIRAVEAARPSLNRQFRALDAGGLSQRDKLYRIL